MRTRHAQYALQLGWPGAGTIILFLLLLLPTVRLQAETILPVLADRNGKNDAWPAIQYALNKAFDEGAGATVRLDAGSYRLSKPLILPRNVALTGVGKGFTSTLKVEGNIGIQLHGEDHPGGYAFRNSVAHLVIDMNDAPADSTAISVRKAYNIRIDDVFAYRVKQRGLHIQDAKHVVVRDTVIYGADNALGTGIDIIDAIVLLDNPDIESVQTALQIEESRNGYGKVSVLGGYIERYGKSALRVVGASGNLFSGLFINTQGSTQRGVELLEHQQTGKCACDNTFISATIRANGPTHTDWPVWQSAASKNNQLLGLHVQPYLAGNETTQKATR